jgi:fatty-acyl-CoA synthase
MHIGDWVARGRASWPTRVAVVDDARGQSFTYAELDRRSDAVAGWLRARGVGRGDRVGALAHNGVEMFDLLFACGKLGALFVPYNWRLARPELEAVVRMTSPHVLFCSRDLLGSGRAAAVGDALVVDLGAPGEAADGYDEILRASAAPVREEALEAEDPWVLLFTGGTTGLPKAVKVSHRMAAWNVLTTTIHHVRHDDVTVVHTPMFHTGGLFVHALPVLTLGGKVIILRRWDVKKVLDLVPRERLTVFFAVPPQLQEMAAQEGFRRADLSSVRLLISGGAPMPLHLPRVYKDAHGIPVAQGFGMTEFGPNALMLAPEDAESRVGSIGRPNTFVDAVVMALDGAIAAEGEIGELCLRGGGLCSGYFGVHGDARSEDGWFHTGDLARQDGGYFTIVGRLKDMFVSGGENVYPLEIEDALYGAESVRQCAVIGVPHEKWGEVGRAFVVLHEGAQATEAELLAFLRTRLAGYKVPKRLEIVDALPLSAAGKILKTELRSRVVAERGES